MTNRFIIIIGSYNNEQWIAQNLESVLTQTYTNFKIVYYNACSTDNTLNIARSYQEKYPDKINVVSTPERHLKTWFFENLTELETIYDNDIICVLDGDDFLASEDVLNYMNEVYKQTKCWMTYGGMIVWNGGENTQQPFPQNSIPDPRVLEQKLYRRDMWRYSHMRTCRGFLWKRLKKDYLKSTTDGNYFTLDDLCTVYPFLEMCPANKIYRVEETTYIWNNSKANESRGCAENKVNNIGQIYETEIRNRPPYPELEIVSPTLAGGLGNQMFEIAAAASLAKDNNALLVINPTEHILPNQGRNVNNYLTNVFHKIATDTAPPLKTVYSWDHIYYKPIPYQPNVKLGGHYQSFKYFDHNREYIQNLFIPNGFCTKHYEFTAIQVRRGDYWKFPDHHPQLTPDYYVKAVKMAGCKNIAIYSDDIQWCEANLKFGPEYYVQYVSKDSDWEELLNMIGSKNIIVSNSSFGWWAAYLNTRKDKQIFVPSVWFGPAIIKDGFKMEDLILPDWNIVQL